MSDRFHIFHQSLLLLMIAAVLLTACSSDNPEAPEVPAGQGFVVHLVPFATSYAEPSSSRRAAPVGYSDYQLDQLTDMGIYIFPSEAYAAATEQLIKYDGAQWHAYFSVDKDETYTVNRLRTALTGLVRDSGKETVFVVFQFDRNRIYQTEYLLVGNVVRQLKEEARSAGTALQYIETDLTQ